MTQQRRGRVRWAECVQISTVSLPRQTRSKTTLTGFVRIRTHADIRCLGQLVRSKHGFLYSEAPAGASDWRNHNRNYLDGHRKTKKKLICLMKLALLVCSSESHHSPVDVTSCGTTCVNNSVTHLQNKQLERKIYTTETSVAPILRMRMQEDQKRQKYSDLFSLFHS